MADERWRWVVGYEGLYMVSDQGRVMSVPRKTGRAFWPGKVLKLRQSNGGYPSVSLSVRGKAKSLMVHRLVAIAFIPNENGKPEVNHKDGDKTNNRVENLEWVTASENLKHAYDVLHRPIGEHFHEVKLNEEAVLEILRCEGTNAEIGKRYGISDVMVGRIKNGKSWRHLTCQSIA